MFFLLETAHESGFPTWGYGVAAFLVLMAALAIVRGIGSSRPHS